MSRRREALRKAAVRSLLPSHSLLLVSSSAPPHKKTFLQLFFSLLPPLPSCLLFPSSSLSACAVTSFFFLLTFSCSFSSRLHAPLRLSSCSLSFSPALDFPSRPLPSPALLFSSLGKALRAPAVPGSVASVPARQLESRRSARLLCCPPPCAFLSRGVRGAASAPVPSSLAQLQPFHSAIKCCLRFLGQSLRQKGGEEKHQWRCGFQQTEARAL